MVDVHWKIDLKLLKYPSPEGDGFYYSVENWKEYTALLSCRMLPVPTEYRYFVATNHTQAFERQALKYFHLSENRQDTVRVTMAAAS